MTFSRVAAGLIVVAALAGCGRGAGPAPQGIPPLTPAPTTPVQTMQLPPPALPEAPAPIETPVSPEAAAAELRSTEQAALTISRPDLAGAWTIDSGGESCKLFMNLTTWTGGYRANTRGCSTDEMKAVGAWDLSGKEVVLKDASGSPVARLYATAAQRYSGQLEVSKRGVQFYR
ncbi:protease inhibitor Inh/omp19 family protein [Methylobrevis pamukkalensis]|uniref:Protease inhibitor Inh n=1 Tax=Methylobrevis pamukkalensis TaxID=1439726 RepID=A0A1E3H7H6_9HYPH|nr:protease inhibitor Inh/omp19 family protein [Methylobrevis pamukkalensis]ODN72270.1 Protease inhibitor Inh [Methylobrevis pamukkalensis]